MSRKIKDNIIILNWFFKIGCVCLLENCECGWHFQYDEINFKEDGIGHNLLGRIFNVDKRE
jgi:hypothetical protein